MTTPYGITPTGFRRKPLEAIKSSIEQRQLATISPDWDTSVESPMGQVNGIMADDFSQLWEVGETSYDASDPDKAEDALLTAICKLTGTERQAADHSVTTLVFTLTSGTLLESGTHFAEDEDHSDSRWTIETDFTAPSDGTYTKAFRAENKGPVELAAGKLTIIATPVNGWVLVAPYNETDATVGRDIEEDPELRQDREAQIANAAGATVDGIRSALEKLLADKGVVSGSVLAFENVTSSTDENGLPANAFEMVVWDGSDDGSAVGSNDIAQTIWKRKGSGARSFGAVIGTAVDANGANQVVNFSRSAVVPIYVEFDLEVDDDFDADDFKLGVATASDELFTGGKDVLATRLISIAWQQDNIENVLGVRVGVSPTPTLDDDVPIDIRSIARFDTGRIGVEFPVIEHSEDHEEQAQGRFIEVYQGKPRLAAWLASYTEESQECEDMLWAVAHRFILELATGDLLDKIGAIVNEKRKSRDDDTYRIYILAKIRINWSQGTPDDVIAVLRIVESAAFDYIEYYPASFDIEYREVPTIGPAILADLVTKAREAGMSSAVVSAEVDDDGALLMSYDDEDSDTQGLADEAETVGGLLANVHEHL